MVALRLHLVFYSRDLRGGESEGVRKNLGDSALRGRVDIEFVVYYTLATGWPCSCLISPSGYAWFPVLQRLERSV